MYCQFFAAVLSDDSAFRRFFAFLWALIAGPALVAIVFLTPPIQVPDEEHHFLRAAQIGEGHVFAERLAPWSSGGTLPRGAAHLAHSFDDIFFHADRKVTVARILAASEDRWETPRAPTDFPNTAIYAPFFYIPQAVGIDLGRLLHQPVLVSFYWGRLASVVCCVALGTAALMLTRRARALMALILSLPMTLSLCASCSQDGLFITSCALLVALLTRLHDDLAESRFYWPALALLLSAILASKPPYTPIVGVPVLLALREQRFVASVVALFAVAVMVLWSVFGLHPVDIMSSEGNTVNLHKQALRLFHHPALSVGLIVHTMQAFGQELWEQYVGVLGWLDAHMPVWLHRTVIVSLLVALGVAALQAHYADHPYVWLRRLAVFALMAGTFCGISLALYLIWTPVGQTLILGLQGRYYLGFSMFLLLLLPETLREHSQRFWRCADLALVVCMPCLYAVATFETLALRYW